MSHTHCVVSWIKNADGTVGIQRLAVGTEEACYEFAAKAKPVTDDPNEIIGVLPLDAWESANRDRIKALN